MATRTIALDSDAYERLRRAKRSPRESFSAVVRRAVWQEEPLTAGALLARVAEQMRTGVGLVPEDVLDRLDRAQRKPRATARKW